MGQKYTEKEKALYRAIDEVLHYMWDPIGVAGEPGARDEYETYVPALFRLIQSGGTLEEVISYLRNIESEQMEQPADEDRRNRVAEILLDWKLTIDER